uniref:NADH-ubiquinone oxidoreductase chain 4L n=1 Tax=Dussumieria elopsoides TaxID=454028 RepID=A0A347YEE6_9TELE|nr:NADH dehydrogenase subunit 4L [Dussumieria elopsoides]
MTPVNFSFTTAFILGLSGLAFNRTHLLSALLCLEGMMMSLYVGLSMWGAQTGETNFFTTPILLLVFSACEAATGLALLVATTRSHGTTQTKALNLLQC